MLFRSLKAKWTAAQIQGLRQFLGVIEARARARSLATVIWPAEQDLAAQTVSQAFIDQGASRRVSGILVASDRLFALTTALAESGIGPVTVTRPDYVFEADCPAVDALKASLAIM